MRPPSPHTLLALLLILQIWAGAEDDKARNAALQDSLKNKGRDETLRFCTVTLLEMADLFRAGKDAQILEKRDDVNRAALWLGTIGSSDNLPELDRFLETRANDSSGIAVTALLSESKIFVSISKSRIVVSSGHLDQEFRRLISIFETEVVSTGNQVPRNSDTEQLQFALCALAAIDEFAPEMSIYAKQKWVRNGHAPVDKSERANLVRFARVYAVNSPLKRQSIIGLLVDENPETRQLGNILASSNPELSDALIEALQSQDTPTHAASIRACLTDILNICKVEIVRNSDELARSRDLDRSSQLKALNEELDSRVTRILESLRK